MNQITDRIQRNNFRCRRCINNRISMTRGLMFGHKNGKRRLPDFLRTLHRVGIGFGSWFLQQKIALRKKVTGLKQSGPHEREVRRRGNMTLNRKSLDRCYSIQYFVQNPIYANLSTCCHNNANNKNTQIKYSSYCCILTD